MTMRGGSVCLIADQAALSHYVIQSAGLAYFTPFSLLGKTPCTFPVDRLVSRVKITPLATERTKPPRQTVFAISNENSEIEQGGPSYCTDDSMSTFSQCEETSDDPKKEAVSFVLSSGEDQLQDDEDQGNQENLLDRLKAVNLHVLAMEQWNASRLKQCHRSYLVSAANLVHYLALKSLDVEQLKEDLSSLGLLNLETMKPFVLPSLSAGIEMLDDMKPNSPKSSAVAEQVTSETILNKPKKSKYTPNTMMKRVVSNMELLLGSLPNEKTTHIMVTVGQEAIESETHIPDLLKAGTTVIRINCAHGNRSVWNEMIRRVKRSSQMLEKPCRILMDLAGPKFRTDKLKPGPCVMKISPKRNACGDVIYPAQVWLSPQGAGPPPSHISLDAVVYVDNQEFIRKVEVGDTVRFYDARGKQRMLKISKKFSVFSGVGFMADCHKTAYIQSGTELYAKRKKQNISVGFVMDVPPAEQFVRLKIGDLLTISRENPNEQDESFCSSSNSHRVTCSSGYLFDSVKPGEVIAFDDGKIWGVIKGTSTSEFIVSITHASPRGSKLGSEKSINIPDSNIRFEGLTSKDLMDLDFVATHADMVGVSFVRDVNDIVLIRQELEKRKLRNLGLVLKIETKGGFEKLPLMLLEAMKLPNPLGVMIARGDLAVECGFERLADIQEEIISICSAAHLPVIWATQVLESLVKSGVPTRAEITDVANARR